MSLPTRLAALVLAAALAAGPAHAQSGAIAGMVRSASGSPVPGATVRVPAYLLEAVADSTGAFFLADVPAGVVIITAREPGFQLLEMPVNVRAGAVVTVTVVLAPRLVTLAPITAAVRGRERERFEEEAQSSTVNLSVRDIRTLPSLAESDVLRAVQLLPGVVTRNDFSVGLNVRGGDADQNLVLLDGQVVFNPFHLGGLFSTFPDQAIEGIEFLTGGFPARYGGRLASVLDVEQRPGSPDSIHGSASVSVLATRLHLEGPLPGVRGSFLVAARRTYADQLVALITPDEFPYHFQDLLARVTLPRVLGGELAVTAFGSGDYFNFVLTEANSGQDEQSFLFNWGNRVLGATWRVALGQRATYVQRAGRSSFFAEIDVGDGLFLFSNRVRRLGLSGDLEIRGARHTFGAGWLAERHDVSYFGGSAEVNVDVAALAYRPRGYELYVDDQWRPVPSLLLRPGLRFTGVTGGGARFAKVAPRFNAKLFVSEQTALTVAAGRYYQPVQSLRQEEIPISLFEFWIGADSVVPVAHADHLVAGVERWFGTRLSLQVEGWWKRMGDLIDGDPSEDPAVPGDEFERARGTAYGGDLYLRRTGEGLTGWVSYSLGWVTRATERGERYTPAQDRRHSLNVVATWQGALGARWTARFGWGSPLPYTPLTGEWIHRFYDPGRNTWIGATVEPYRAERNAARYPAYVRMDVAAQWEFGWLGARWKPTASLLNASARTNVFVYFYDYDQRPPIRRGFTQFPFLPTVGMDVEF